MKKYFVLSLMLFLFLSINKSSAQFSQLPIELKNAYQKGTRSHTGYPGVNYWQNNAKYVIQVELDAEKQTIKGEEQIIYFIDTGYHFKETLFDKV